MAPGNVTLHTNLFFFVLVFFISTISIHPKGSLPIRFPLAQVFSQMWGGGVPPGRSPREGPGPGDGDDGRRRHLPRGHLQAAPPPCPGYSVRLSVPPPASFPPNPTLPCPPPTRLNTLRGEGGGPSPPPYLLGPWVRGPLPPLPLRHRSDLIPPGVLVGRS